MPELKKAPSLSKQAKARLAKMIRDSLVRLDSVWSSEPSLRRSNNSKSPRNSPKVSPVSHRMAGVLLPPVSDPALNAFPGLAPGEVGVADPIDLIRWANSGAPATGIDFVENPGKICDQQQALQRWLLDLPTTLLEDVVQKVLELIEFDVNDDKDRKIILTLINIEKSKPSDFSFGIYSLLLCLASTSITRIPFSTKLWFCIWEYEQLTTTNHLKHCLTESIPDLTHLVSINFSYIATDQIVYLLSKNCPSLEDLCLDHSSVSDRCARFFCGYEKSSTTKGDNQRLLTRIQQQHPTTSFLHSHGNAYHNATSPIHYRQGNTSSSTYSLYPSSSSGLCLLGDMWGETSNTIPVVCSSSTDDSVIVPVTGCPELKYLSLQGCSSITDKAIWYLLLHKPRLQILRYHQAYSVAEILCKECVNFKPPNAELHDDCNGGDLGPSQKRLKFTERADDSNNDRTALQAGQVGTNDVESKSDVDSQQTNAEKSTGDRNESNNDQKRKKFGSNGRISQSPKTPELDLRVFDHPFPYGLSLSSDVIKQVSIICPHITTLNLVAGDEFIADYAQMTKLTKVAIELEDCFGTGLYRFLRILGHQLTEISLSCSSDLESTFLEGGGQPYQLFNVGLRIVKMCCPNVTHLNISGCGLVSNQLIEQLEREDKGCKEHSTKTLGWKKDTSSLQHLKSLILLTYYDDDVHIQTCEEKLLLSTLQGCKKLECISLEGNFSTFLTDSFINAVLGVNPLAHLKIFDIRGRTPVPLTQQTARRFMQLPQIKELRMSSWNISDQEFSILEETVKKFGWDLHLTKRVLTSTD